MDSRKFALNGTDWKSIGVGACIALGGALLTYFADSVIPAINVGSQWTPLVVSLLSVAVNVGRKWLAGKN